MASKLRPYHRDLCVLLSTSNETLVCLTGSLFGARVIDKINKTALIGQKGFERADQLLNLIYDYLEGDDDSDEKNVRFETVLGLLEAEEMLRDVTRKIRGQEENSRDGIGRVASTVPVQYQSHSSSNLLQGTTDQHSHVDSESAAKQTLALPVIPACTVESSAFTEELSQDPRWYTLGILLGIPTQELEVINLNCHSAGIKKCLVELYNFMEARGILPSWGQVTEALRRMNNYLLADKIYSDHIRLAVQLSPLSGERPGSEMRRERKRSPIDAASTAPIRLAQSSSGIDNALAVAEPPPIADNNRSDDFILVSEEIEQSFMRISSKFATLVLTLKTSLEECNVPISNIQFVLQEHYDLKPLKGDNATIDGVFARLCQHYCVLHYHVLVYLAETFLANQQSLLQLVNDYQTDVEMFKNSAIVRDLMIMVTEKRVTTGRHQVVKLKVREFWGTAYLRKFEVLVKEILQTLHHCISQIRVEKGCVCISWVIPNFDTSKLIMPQPLEFIKIIGVISLHIGDRVIYDIPGEGCEVMEAAMLQAIELKNTRATQLLLAAGCELEASTKGRKNALTLTANIHDSSETQFAVEYVCTFDYNQKKKPLTNESDINDSSSIENVSREEMKTSAFGKSSIEKNDQKLEGIEKGGKDFNLQKNLPEDDAFMETDEVEPEDSDLKNVTNDLRLKVEDLEKQNKSLTEQLQEKEADLDLVPEFYKKKKAGDRYKPSDCDGFSLIDEVTADLSKTEPCLELKHHDINIQIDEDYWRVGPSEVLACCLAAGLQKYSISHPVRYGIISPVCFLSFKTERAVQVHFNVPHALKTLNEDYLKRMEIFSAASPSSHSLRSEFTSLVPEPGLTVDDRCASFTATLYEPSLFVLGLKTKREDPPDSPLPLVPLRCCLYVIYPDDLEQYLLGTDIKVYITLYLSTFQTGMMKELEKNQRMEKKEFILSEPKVTVNGTLDNSPSDWVSLKDGNGLHEYTKIVFEDSYTLTFNYKYTRFVVQCFNPKKPMTFRVSVVNDNYEIEELFISPSTLLSKEEETGVLSEESEEAPNLEQKIDMMETRSAKELAYSDSQASQPADSLQVTPGVSADKTSVTSSQGETMIYKTDGKPLVSSSREKNRDSNTFYSLRLREKLSRVHLTREHCSYVFKDHNIKIVISPNYWNEYPLDVVLSESVVPDWMNCICPSGYIFITQQIYLNFVKEWPVEVQLTLPHSLANCSEDYLERIVVFTSNASNASKRPSVYLDAKFSLQQFCPVSVSDLILDNRIISFATKISKPVLVAVGFAVSAVGVAPSPLPIVPLRCVIYVKYANELDKYLSGTDIHVRISVDTGGKLKGEEQFILFGPKLTVSGTMETSSDGWKSVRRGKSSFCYDEVVLSDKWNEKSWGNPAKATATFFVKCINPEEPSKFRVKVLCHNNNELVNKLIPLHNPAEGAKSEKHSESEGGSGSLQPFAAVKTIEDSLSGPWTESNSARKRRRDEEDFETKKIKVSKYDRPELAVQTSSIDSIKLKKVDVGVQFNYASLETDSIEIKNVDVGVQFNYASLETDSIEMKKVDVGVQFNYASLETDHLQGVTISRSKLFTVHGEQPQSLVWDGHGFELHLPKGTCLPDEDCEIMVDTVVGGEFVFPKGVEPVSAIYIISITSKLRKPSLLKIQHCVALDKASEHSRLSFYRGLLKEPNPPYHFRRVNGGKFDINNQFGELELPVFCAMAIGKDSPNSADEPDTDTQSVEGSMSTSSGFGDMDQEVDSSIIYYGQGFYVKKQLNQWHFKFIVVKHLDAFTEYVRSNLSDHEDDVQTTLRFNAHYIELVVNKEYVAGIKGWNILPHAIPCVIPLKHAASFGYEKNVPIPPTCLVTILGDNSVPDYVQTLNYSVLLRGALIGGFNEDSMICIIRTMSKEDDMIPLDASSNQTAIFAGQTCQVDAKAVISCIKDEIDENFADLQYVFKNSLEEVSAELFSSHLITNATKEKPSFEAIIREFNSALPFKKTVPKIEQHFKKFFGVLRKVGGPFTDVADLLKENIMYRIRNKLDLKLNFD